MLDKIENTYKSDKLIEKLNVRLGFNLFHFLNVKPEPEYSNYSAVFMSAMQKPLIWLYKGITPENISSSISTGFCIRSEKGFTNAGSSNRHLKCFEMLTIAGQMHEEQMLALIVQLLKDNMPNNVNIIAHVYPNDRIAQNFFMKHNISFILKDECYFKEPDKTDREGHRVELNLMVQNVEEEICWEIFNCVFITATNYGENKLNLPLVEASGSLERFLVFSEGKDHVLKTSRFDIDSVTAILQNVNINVIYKFTDLLRTVIILSQSGYNLGQSIRKSDKLQILYTTACNEFMLHCLINNISFEIIINLIQRDFELIKSFGYDCEEIGLQRLILELAEIFQKLNKKIENIKNYIRSNVAKLGTNKSIERALRLHDGDAKRLLPIIEKLNKDI